MLDTALEAKVLANKDESKCLTPLIAVNRPVRDRYVFMVIMIIHGSRSVFHDSKLAFMVLHGSRLVYIRAECQRRVVRC